jgi:tetratricopeptide (TPR) repeat protein
MKKESFSKIIVLILSAILISFFSSPLMAATDVSKLPKEAIKALYLAQQALKEENYDETIKTLTEYMAVATEAIPLPAYQMLGHAYYQKKDTENTRKTFETAHKAFPDNTEMLQNYTILTYETGRLIEAAQLFEKLYRQKGKTDKKILHQAAGIYFQAENLTEAKRVLTELLTSGGELDLKWYDDMIALCVEQQQWKDAEKWAKEFLERQPEKAEYWRLLAQMRLDRDEYKSAASALEIAYRLNPPRPSEWLELSDLYLYLNAPLMAIRCMEVGYGNDLDDNEQLKIARVYARTRRFHEALKAVDEAFQKYPKASVLLEKGRLLYDARRYNDAIAALEACVKMDSKQGEAWFLMGFAAWNLKDWEKARSSFVSASALPKYHAQANDAVTVLDDLMEAFKRSTQTES